MSRKQIKNSDSSKAPLPEEKEGDRYIKWGNYLGGLGFSKSAMRIGKEVQLDFLKDGAVSIGKAIEGGRDPMEMAKEVYKKGYKVEDFVDDLSYDHVTKTSTTHLESRKYFGPMLTELTRYAYGRKHGDVFEVLDLGCGTAAIGQELIGCILRGLGNKNDIKIRYRQEDNEPIAVFIAALRAIEMMENYPNIEIVTYYNDMRNAHKKFDAQPVDLALSSIAMFPYLPMGEQRKVLKRLDDMKASALIVSGQADFDTREYLKTGFLPKGFKGRSLAGLKAEKRSLLGLGEFPKSLSDLRRVFRSVRYTVKAVLPTIGGNDLVNPSEKNTLRMYKEYGWKIYKKGKFYGRASFIPIGYPNASRKDYDRGYEYASEEEAELTSKAVVLGLVRDGE